MRLRLGAFRRVLGYLDPLWRRRRVRHSREYLDRLWRGRYVRGSTDGRGGAESICDQALCLELGRRVGGFVNASSDGHKRRLWDLAVLHSHPNPNASKESRECVIEDGRNVSC